MTPEKGGVQNIRVYELLEIIRYLSLVPQLNTVVIEVSCVQVLGRRGNPQKLYRAKHLPSQNGTYGDTGVYSIQTS